MQTLPTSVGSWELTSSAFHLLLERLDSDPEASAIKYENLRLKLLKFFEHRGVAGSDEAADRVIDRVARKLSDGEDIQNLNAYSLGVARLYALERLRGPLMDDIDELAKPLMATDSRDKQEEKETLMQCLDCCLERLPEKKRRLILEYHKGEGGERIRIRQVLAQEFSLTVNALRIQVARLSHRLEECINNCARKECGPKADRKVR